MKKIFPLLLIAALCLCACGSTPPPAVTESPAAAPVETASIAEPTPEPEQQPTPEPTPESDAFALAAEALQAEYRELMRQPIEDFDEAAHPEIPWYSAIMFLEGRNRVFYGFYDFDGNGVDELVMAVGDEDYRHPIGIYAYDGTGMVYLCREQALGERANVSFSDGIFTVQGSGGAASGGVIRYRIGADGYSTDILAQYDYEYQPEGGVEITNFVGDTTAEEFEQTDLWAGLDAEIQYVELR